MFRLSLFALLLLCSRTAALMQYKPLRTIRAQTRHLRLQSTADTKDDGKQSDRLFADWEDEELQQAQSEKLNEVQQMRDEFGYQSLPAYALKWLKDFEADDGATAAAATPASKLPTMVIVGRPNTGKSTLVNRISGVFKEGAIVHDEPGITRDRTYRVAQYGEYNFQVVDTGGIIFDDNKDVFADRIIEQATIALQEASVAVVVCDGMEGVTPLDEILVDWLRKSRKIPILLAVNKCESEKNGFMQSQEFWKLGVGTPYPVSGIHGSGVYDLLDAAAAHLPKVTNILAENITNVALVGRPNVGKSSLLNRLYGQSRAIVSDVAGTTRDTVDVLVNRGHNRTYRIIDTAGIRKRGKIEYGPEFFMINRAFKAIRRSDCVVLLLDAVTGIVDQDRVLAQRIADEGRACVIALNKWDAIPNKTDKSYLAAIENVRAKLSALRWADIVLISALQGQRTEKLFESIDRATQQFNRRIPTGVLNEVVTDATLWMPPPSVGSRSGRIYYCMQISAAPPTIVLFVNDPELFTDAYKRYLERKIRDSLNFEGTPIKLIWRGKSLRSVSRSAQRGEIGELTSKAVKSSHMRN